MNLPTQPETTPAFVSRPTLGLLLLLVILIPAAAGIFVQFRTPIGDIDVELFEKDKPITVQNFLRYLTNGGFDNGFIHRWEPGFVIQGGGFFITNRNTTNDLIDVVTSYGDILNEYSAGKIYSNTYGTLAMARVGGETNSATSEWFINLTNNAFLDTVDGGFTVFGRVVRGTNVLQRFNLTTLSNGIYRADAGGALNHLPVLSFTPTLNDLVFVDMTLLRVAVTRQPNGSREISWNSLSNVLHTVEFTTNFPPIWTTLTTTNGTGKRLSIVDPSTDPTRFYRVRGD